MEPPLSQPLVAHGNRSPVDLGTLNGVMENMLSHTLGWAPADGTPARGESNPPQCTHRGEEGALVGGRALAFPRLAVGRQRQHAEALHM